MLLKYGFFFVVMNNSEIDELEFLWRVNVIWVLVIQSTGDAEINLSRGFENLIERLGYVSVDNSFNNFTI